jgi:hypothetical protein
MWRCVARGTDAAPPPQGAYCTVLGESWHIVVGTGMRYSLTGGGGEWSGPRTTHDATYLRSTHGRGAPEESELTQTWVYHRT